VKQIIFCEETYFNVSSTKERRDQEGRAREERKREGLEGKKE